VDWAACEADLLDHDDWLPPLDSHEPAQVTSTAIATPGYLNTPSKRAARAKALAKMSIMPVTPFTTPFAARLKAGAASSPLLLAGGAFPTARKENGMARSGLGLNVRAAKGDQGDVGYDDR
jgi:protein SFI1